MLSAIKSFFRLESASSLMLVAMAILAMAAANSPLTPYYNALHSKTAILIVNDGLMTLFFLCVGIEIKQEIKEDRLSAPAQLALPVMAALGGVITPALIYSFANWHSAAMHGWAIPTATDIAFSLGILNLFGKRTPPALRILLMTIAIFDDLLAIIIIAVFYTQDIQFLSLVFSFGCVLLLAFYNRYVRHIMPFILAGCALWVALLDTGVTPTIAGVILGLLMPMDMGKRALHFLEAWVAFLVVPLFVFVSSGVSFASLYSSHIANPVSLGIAGGLFLGKQLGIFTTAFILIRSGWAKLPYGASWLQLYAMSILSGIGFTMSLFIGSLAFSGEPLILFTKVGVLMGSLVSVAAGSICMALSHKNLSQ